MKHNLRNKPNCCLPALVPCRKITKRPPQNLEEFLSCFLVSSFMGSRVGKKCSFFCWKQHGKNILQPGPTREEGTWCWAPGCSEMANSSAEAGDARPDCGKCRTVNNLTTEPASTRGPCYTGIFCWQEKRLCAAGSSANVSCWTSSMALKGEGWCMDYPGCQQMVCWSAVCAVPLLTCGSQCDAVLTGSVSRSVFQ